MNIAACGVTLFGQFVGIDNPITIIQMLWINIIMDTLGGLAFAGEAPLNYYMKEKPKSREEPILTKEILKRIVFTGGYTLILSIVFLTSPVIRNLYGGVILTEKFYTAFYALFVFSGIFNCFTSRCERIWIFSNIEKNKLLLEYQKLLQRLEDAEKWAIKNNFNWDDIKDVKYKIWLERDNIIKEIEFVRELLGLQ